MRHTTTVSDSQRPGASFRWLPPDAHRMIDLMSDPAIDDCVMTVEDLYGLPDDELADEDVLPGLGMSVDRLFEPVNRRSR